MEIKKLIYDIENTYNNVTHSLYKYEQSLKKHESQFYHLTQKQNNTLDKQLRDMRAILKYANIKFNNDYKNLDQNTKNLIFEDNINAQDRRKKNNTYTAIINNSKIKSFDSIPMFNNEFDVLERTLIKIKTKELKIDFIIQWFRRWNSDAVFSHQVILRLLTAFLTIQTKDVLLYLILDFSKQEQVLRFDFDNRTCWPIRRDHIHLPNLLIRNHNIDKHYDMNKKQFHDMNLFLKSEQQLQNQHMGKIIIFSQTRDKDQIEEEYQAEEFDRFIKLIKENGSFEEEIKIKFYQDLLLLDKAQQFIYVDQYLIFSKSNYNMINDELKSTPDEQLDRNFNHNVFNIPHKNLKSSMNDKIQEVNNRKNIKFYEWGKVGITEQDLEMYTRMLQLIVKKDKEMDYQNLKLANFSDHDNFQSISNQLQTYEDEENQENNNDEFDKNQIEEEMDPVLKNDKKQDHDVIKRLSKNVKSKYANSFRNKKGTYNLDSINNDDSTSQKGRPKNNNSNEDEDGEAPRPRPRGRPKVQDKETSKEMKTNKKLENKDKIDEAQENQTYESNQEGMFQSKFLKNQCLTYQKESFKLKIVNRNSRFLSVRTAWFYTLNVLEWLKVTNHKKGFNVKEEDLNHYIATESKQNPLAYNQDSISDLPLFSPNENLAIENQNNNINTPNYRYDTPNNEMNDSLVNQQIVKSKANLTLDQLFNKYLPKFKNCVGMFKNRINQVSIQCYLFNLFSICKYDEQNRIVLNNFPFKLMNTTSNGNNCMEFLPDSRVYFSVKDNEIISPDKDNAKKTFSLIQNNPVINEFFRRFKSQKYYNSNHFHKFLMLIDRYLDESNIQTLVLIIRNQMNLNMNKNYQSAKETEAIFKLYFFNDQNRYIEQSQFNFMFLNQQSDTSIIPLLSQNLNLGHSVFQTTNNLQAVYQRQKQIKLSELIRTDDPIHKNIIFDQENQEIFVQFYNVARKVNIVSLDFQTQGLTNSYLLLQNTILQLKCGSLDFLLNQDLNEKKRIVVDIDDLKIDGLKQDVFNEKIEQTESLEQQKPILNTVNQISEIKYDNLYNKNVYNYKYLQQLFSEKSETKIDL